MSQPYAIALNDVTSFPTTLTGQQAKDIADLQELSIPTSKGFVVTSHTFKVFNYVNQLDKLFDEQLEHINLLHHQDIIRLSHQLQKQLRNALLPEEIAIEIIKFYNRYCHESYVEVNFSFPNEETLQLLHSYNLTTNLYLKGDANLLEGIKTLWSQLYSPDLIAWRARRKLDHKLPQLSILVKAFPKVKISGLMATTDPAHNNSQLVSIDAVWGLPDDLIAGMIDSDHYQVEKLSWRIDEYVKAKQRHERSLPHYQFRKKIWPTKVNKPKLNHEQIVTLAKVGYQIQKHFYYPQLVTWSVSDKGLLIHRLEQLDMHLEKTTTVRTKHMRRVLGTGWSVSPNVVSGKVKVVTQPKDIVAIKPHTIVVTHTLSEKYLPIFRTAKGLITEHGGELSHSAVLAREIGIPVITGVNKITEILKDEDIVTIDGTTGQIFSGYLKTSSIQQLKSESNDNKNLVDVQTWIELKTTNYTVSTPDIDGLAASSESWLRFKNYSIPQVVTSVHKERLASELTDYLSSICEHLGERTIIFSISPEVLNPGNEQWFGFELNCFLNTFKDYSSIEFALPQVSTTEQLNRLVSYIHSHHHGQPKFRIWFEVGTPALALNPSYLLTQPLHGIILNAQSLAEHFYGYSVHSNKLTSDQLTSPDYFDFLEHILTKIHRFQTNLVLKWPQTQKIMEPSLKYLTVKNLKAIMTSEA